MNGYVEKQRLEECACVRVCVHRLRQWLWQLSGPERVLKEGKQHGARTEHKCHQSAIPHRPCHAVYLSPERNVYTTHVHQMVHIVTTDISAFVPLRHESLYPVLTQSVSSVSSREATACLTSTSSANRLPASQAFLKGPKDA
jgi:hypothetical protein